MKPGRELDALVAEKVMGWEDCDPTAKWDRWQFGDPGDEWTNIEAEWCRGDGIAPDDLTYRQPYPRYSESIADAWLVVKKLSASYLFCLENSGSFWVADFGRSADGRAQRTAETAPHAICLAALKAVEYERGEP